MWSVRSFVVERPCLYQALLIREAEDLTTLRPVAQVIACHYHMEEHPFIRVHQFRTKRDALLPKVFMSRMPEDESISKTRSLRLENGVSPCAGRVEIHYKGQWGTVRGVNWDLRDATVVCRELDCGTAISAPRGSHFGPGTGPVVIGNFWCNGTEHALLDCTSWKLKRYNKPHNDDAGVICSEQVMLVPQNSECFGRLEVQFDHTWKTVCGLDWDLKNANVVCAQLHCGVAVSVSSFAHSGGSTVLMGSKVFECTGNETQLGNCPRSSTTHHDCSGYNNVTLTCSDESWSPRLVNGRNRCDGQLEVYYNGSWGRVQNTLWDLNAAHVVCRQLGCGYALETHNTSNYRTVTRVAKTPILVCTKEFMKKLRTFPVARSRLRNMKPVLYAFPIPQ
ncbi:hypothetical protein chiPu_0020467 [Chiloscyllium punctatum]|uniref:SRCR domain-containing protein n=1 Tax=Chiloscyllium punctatum TaxID=137246 RepID=A0A401RFZ4_CHIPU|nr:hypothetical protein [Chiloscyllium punctatum]